MNIFLRKQNHFSWCDIRSNYRILERYFEVVSALSSQGFLEHMTSHGEQGRPATRAARGLVQFWNVCSSRDTVGKSPCYRLQEPLPEPLLIPCFPWARICAKPFMCNIYDLRGGRKCTLELVFLRQSEVNAVTQRHTTVSHGVEMQIFAGNLSLYCS